MGMPFELSSRYYDLLYAEKDYAGETRYVLDAMLTRRPGIRKILELGCGTGAHAIHMAEAGMEVVGVDISSAMLERARDRIAGAAQRHPTNIRFFEGDARSVRIPEQEQFDAVVALFHVMSYQTTWDDLQAIYETARLHLKPGGLFLFDYWWGPAVLTQHPQIRVKRLNHPQLEIIRVAEPVLHFHKQVCDVHYTVFTREGPSSSWNRFEELHAMRYLFQSELDALQGLIWTTSEDFAWMEKTAPHIQNWSAMRLSTLDGPFPQDVGSSKIDRAA